MKERTFWIGFNNTLMCTQEGKFRFLLMTADVEYSEDSPFR